MSNQNPIPASGPKLSTAIDQALAHVVQFAKKKGYSENNWPDHLRLWKEILQQSRNQASRDVAPMMKRGDLAAPIGLKLDGRYWQRFQNWFVRNIEPELRAEMYKSGVPMLHAFRVANRSGGYHEQSEALIYLFFDMPVSVQMANVHSLPIKTKDISVKMPLTSTLHAGQVAAVKKDKRLQNFFRSVSWEFRFESKGFKAIKNFAGTRYGRRLQLMTILGVVVLPSIFFPRYGTVWTYLGISTYLLREVLIL